ncbi:MAG: hypothetical protein LVQ95_04490 [Candidatus Micrarchaeales archaeon]|nr:hypothetical protein [Candidatus Micrarchaeales archaeon]
MKFPSVKVKSYLYLVDRASSQKSLDCSYCGAENFSDKDVWVCYNCELANYGAMRDIWMNNKVLIDQIAQVNKLIGMDDFAGAAAEYEKILTMLGEPEFLYSAALIHKRNSNHEISLIRYDRMGFMEENAVHKENAIKESNRAALLLNKASAALEEQFKKGIRQPASIFTFFMTNIKLGNLKTAKRGIGMLKVSGNLYLSKYADMVFNAELLKPVETAVASIDCLKVNTSVNAVYYLGWALFKGKRYREATDLLTGIRKYVDTGNIDAMLQNIESAKEV